MSTARKESLKNLYTNRTLSYTSKESILVLERRSGCCDFTKNIEINTRKVARVFPSRTNTALKMQKWDLVFRDGGNVLNLGTEELR